MFRRTNSLNVLVFFIPAFLVVILYTQTVIIQKLDSSKTCQFNLDSSQKRSLTEENHQHQGTGQCNVMKWEGPLEKNAPHLSLQTDPSVVIYLHNVTKDYELSGQIYRTGLWEPTLTETLQNILRTKPAAGFIDVGTNIGVFSLLAAAMGHKVVSVEPLPANHRLFYTSVMHNNLQDRITLVRNAVSDQRGNLRFYVHHSLSGRGELQSDDFVLTKKAARSGELINVPVIRTDDLSEVIDFPEAVMKMDIEGNEHRALLGAQNLINNVNITHIFVEWDKIKKGCADTVDVNSPIQRLMLFLETNKYKVRSLHGTTLTGDCEMWPNVIMLKKQIR